MKKLFIQGLYSVIGKLDGENRLFSFKVNLPDKRVVNVEVVPGDNEVKAIEEADVSVGLFKAMEAGGFGNLSEDLESELSGLTQNISLATRRVVNIIKYCFNQYQIDEELIASKGLFWSKEGENWNRVSRKLKVALLATGFQRLNEDSCRLVQEYIDSEYQPFLALRHLHRARKESNPRHEWIEATIAAELAIKEFLIRFKPELATFILEVPSPPIHKMYGVVFEEYTGKKIDKKIFKALVKGAEVRNRLLHRPEQEIIDFQEAKDYISAVSEAVRILLLALYPKHRLIV